MFPKIIHRSDVLDILLNTHTQKKQNFIFFLKIRIDVKKVVIIVRQKIFFGYFPMMNIKQAH